MTRGATTLASSLKRLLMPGTQRTKLNRRAGTGTQRPDVDVTFLFPVPDSENTENITRM